MWDDLPQNSVNKAILSQKTSSLWKLGSDTLNTSSKKLFLHFWTVSKLWYLKYEISMKHYDEICILYTNLFTR